jgi:Uma2 family endonuclease
MTQSVQAQQDANYPHRFNVLEFERLFEAGVFGEDVQVELLDGEIFVMPEMGDDHADSLTRLNKQLIRKLGDHVEIAPQIPLDVAEGETRPLPDFIVIDIKKYEKRKPVPSDVLLLIEISDSTLNKDRNRKSLVYARNGILEYWIVNLKDQQLEVFRHPENGVYPKPDIYKIGQPVAPLSFPDVQIEWW